MQHIEFNSTNRKRKSVKNHSRKKAQKAQNKEKIIFVSFVLFCGYDFLFCLEVFP